MANDGTLAAGTVDSWLIWNLTGGAVHATDPTNASRTMLYDIRSLEWSDDLLRAVRRAARDAARGARIERRLRRRARRAARAHARHSDSRRRRRSAGRALRAGMLGARGRGRTRTAPARFCCSTPERSAASPGGGLLTTDRVRCERRVRRTRSKARSSSPAPPCSGCATDSASSRARAETRGARERDHVERRRVLRSGAHGTRRTALGAGGARHDRRAHARHDARASRARRARGDGVRHGGRARGDAAARRAARSIGCASMAAQRRTTG